VADNEFTDLPWGVMRCRKCDRVLLKRTSAQPLLPGEKVAVKCRRCDELNMMVGPPRLVDVMSGVMVMEAATTG
jgi:phage FluMu protein Com